MEIMKTAPGRKKILLTFILILLLLLAVLNFLYALIVSRAHSGSPFFVVWILFGFLFCGLAVMLRFHLFSRLPVLLKGMMAVGAGLCLLLLLVTQALVISGMDARGVPELSYVIVLGAQVRSSGPTVVTRYRLEKAMQYLSENPDTKVIVSGGQGWNEPAPEAVVMKEYLVSHGIPEAGVLTEEQSRNTEENIRFSAGMLDPSEDSIGIVTNNFHIFRAVSIARKQGYRNVYGIAAPSNPLYLPNNMLRESFGIVKDFLCGNL